MLDIIISTIPHHQQRYETIGDWVIYGDKIIIYVSDLKDKYKEYLVADHELREAMLCMKRDITQKQVDEFDINFEKNRAPNDFSEPGDSKNAPYRDEHRFATIVEKMTADELGVNWKDYEEAINNIGEPSNVGA